MNNNTESRETPTSIGNLWSRTPLWWSHALRNRQSGALNWRAYLVAECLSAHADKQTNKAWPSAETIAAETLVRRDRVFEAIRDLKAAGIIIEGERRYNSSTIFTLCYDNPEVPVNGVPESGTAYQGEVPVSGERSTRNWSSEVPDPRYANRTTEQNKEKNDVRSLGHEEPNGELAKVSADLIAFGISPSIVRRCVKEHPAAARAWLTVDWDRDYPKIENREAFLTQNLKAGTMPIVRVDPYGSLQRLPVILLVCGTPHRIKDHRLECMELPCDCTEDEKLAAIREYYGRTDRLTYGAVDLTNSFRRI